MFDPADDEGDPEVPGGARRSGIHFRSGSSDETDMETDSWVERLLINELTTVDRRYKYDRSGVEKTTDELIGATEGLDAMMTEDGPAWPSLDDLLLEGLDEEFERKVERRLQALEDRGLVEFVEERERLGPPLEPGDYGTTAVWTATLAGRDEARKIDARTPTRWQNSSKRTSLDQTNSGPNSARSLEITGFVRVCLADAGQIPLQRADGMAGLLIEIIPSLRWR